MFKSIDTYIFSKKKLTLSVNLCLTVTSLKFVAVT